MKWARDTEGVAAWLARMRKNLFVPLAWALPFAVLSIGLVRLLLHSGRTSVLIITAVSLYLAVRVSFYLWRRASNLPARLFLISVPPDDDFREGADVLALVMALVIVVGASLPIMLR